MRMEPFMSKTWRVAVASLDGKVINQHFGRADSFYIVDLQSDGSKQVIEQRNVVPLCVAGEHTDEALLESVTALRDCSAVLVARIGAVAKRALELNKIAVFEQPDYIDDALQKLSKYFIKSNNGVNRLN